MDMPVTHFFKVILDLPLNLTFKGKEKLLEYKPVDVKELCVSIWHV